MAGPQGHRDRRWRRGLPGAPEPRCAWGGPATLRRPAAGGQAAWAQGQRRARAGQRYVSCGGDGVDVEPRRADARPDLLVMLGAEVTGHPGRVGLWEGSRESAPAWQARRRDRTSRGRALVPTWALGDGAADGPGLRQAVPRPAAAGQATLACRWMAPDRQWAARALDLGIAPEEAQ